MTRRHGAGPARDDPEVVEEVSLQDAAFGAGQWWDRALVVLAAVAVGGGLLIAAANAVGLMGGASAAGKA